MKKWFNVFKNRWGRGQPDDIGAINLGDENYDPDSDKKPRAGQILWIRGLTRLQTQVTIPISLSFHHSITKEQKAINNEREQIYNKTLSSPITKEFFYTTIDSREPPPQPPIKVGRFSRSFPAFSFLFFFVLILFIFFFYPRRRCCVVRIKKQPKNNETTTNHTRTTSTTCSPPDPPIFYFMFFLSVISAR